MADYPCGTRAWFGVPYRVVFVVDMKWYSIPEGSEYFSRENKEGFSVAEGSIVMFPNMDFVFYTGKTVEVVHSAIIEEIKILGDRLMPNERIFWRKHPVSGDTQESKGEEDENE